MELSALLMLEFYNLRATLLQMELSPKQGWHSIFGVTGNPFSITTTGDTVSFTDAVNLISNTTINSNGGNITFNNIVDGDFNFTLNAAGGNVL